MRTLPILLAAARPRSALPWPVEEVVSPREDEGGVGAGAGESDHPPHEEARQGAEYSAERRERVERDAGHMQRGCNYQDDGEIEQGGHDRGHHGNLRRQDQQRPGRLQLGSVDAAAAAFLPQVAQNSLPRCSTSNVSTVSASTPWIA